MLTHAGKGYSPAFTRNMARVLGKLSAGAEIEIVAGPDDICAPLLRSEDAPHCHNCSVLERDNLAARAVQAILGTEIIPGTVLRLQDTQLRAMRSAFEEGRFATACANCEWSPLCQDIARGGFEAVTLARIDHDDT